jgi:hypothetical protein
MNEQLPTVSCVLQAMARRARFDGLCSLFLICKSSSGSAAICEQVAIQPLAAIHAELCEARQLTQRRHHMLPVAGIASGTLRLRLALRQRIECTAVSQRRSFWPTDARRGIRAVGERVLADLECGEIGALDERSERLVVLLGIPGICSSGSWQASATPRADNLCMVLRSQKFVLASVAGFAPSVR